MRECENAIGTSLSQSSDSFNFQELFSTFSIDIGPVVPAHFHEFALSQIF